MEKNKKYTFIHKMSFKLRTTISFVLVCLLPASVFFYGFFILKYLPAYLYIMVAVCAFFGWIIMHDVVSSIGLLVKQIREEWSEELEDSQQGDLVFLEAAFDTIKDKVKHGVEELSTISKTSEKLTQDVVGNVTLLSAVIKLNELMLIENNDDQIYKYISKKIREILALDMSFILDKNSSADFFDMKYCDTVRHQDNDFNGISTELSFMKSLLTDKQMVVVDRNNRFRSDFMEYFEKELGIYNVLMMPVVVNGDVSCLMACGTLTDRHIFSPKDMEVVEFFMRYIVFLQEQQQQQVSPAGVTLKELDLKDTLTGLYTEKFMIDRLDEELSKAVNIHKPCGILLYKLTNFKQLLGERSSLELETVLKKAARVLTDNLQEGEKAARCAEDVFGLIMPALNKKRLELVANDLLYKLKTELGEEFDNLGIVCSIAECPVDGSTTDELITHAGALLMKRDLQETTV